MELHGQSRHKDIHISKDELYYVEEFRGYIKGTYLMEIIGKWFVENDPAFMCGGCGTREELEWYAPLQEIYCDHCIYNIELGNRGHHIRGGEWDEGTTSTTMFGMPTLQTFILSKGRRGSVPRRFSTK